MTVGLRSCCRFDVKVLNCERQLRNVRNRVVANGLLAVDAGKDMGPRRYTAS